jgi:RNA polymerase-binding transcription factor DksA
VVSPIPAPKGVTKDGIAYTKDFDAKFLTGQRDLLNDEKVMLLGQARRLEDEANQLIQESEMGDVQFDDEGGEGDTMVVERERDLALSAQARQTIADIDAALARLTAGTYGYSEQSGRPIPRERLEALPWATVLVEEKVGGIGRR